MMIKPISHLIKCQHKFIKSHQSIQKRFLDATKKFYRLASVNLNENNRYEIKLDNRKLKTPKGKLFEVKNESLAQMIAQEWNGQLDKIKRHEMHLTSLVNTQLDNPCNLNKEQLIEHFVEQLQSDTLCYRVGEPDELSNYLKEGWNPLVHQFESTFQCRLPVTETVFLDEIPIETKNKVKHYLNSFDPHSLFGLQFILDNLKSLVLSLALINKTITVDESVRLSRLEQEFQIQKWGQVEWAHDLDLNLLRSRVSAGLMHFILNNEFEFHQQTNSKTNNQPDRESQQRN